MDPYERQQELDTWIDGHMDHWYHASLDNLRLGYECLVCGALVVNSDQHAKWHLNV